MTFTGLHRKGRECPFIGSTRGRVLGCRFMLHAALIGFGSSGKTTLFQLMTSAREAPRGKGDVNIGVSRVPDARLDTLTAMYNPRKRVPATVEFTDLVATRSGAQTLV